MAFYLQEIILTALILAAAIPISTSHRRRWRRSDNQNLDDKEQYLRDLCSETDKPDVCWNIFKSDLHKFDGADDRDIADGVIDSAIAKSREIGDQLSQWSSDSNDDGLREKYRTCSSNYNDVNHNLEDTRRKLDSDNNREILDRIDDAQEELEKCKREFENSFDPGHVGDRNNELELYLDMARVSSDRLEDYYEDEVRD